MFQISDFLSENFQFLVVNFSIYLNRRVFVMAFLINDTSTLVGHFVSSPKRKETSEKLRKMRETRMTVQTKKKYKHTPFPHRLLV